MLKTTSKEDGVGGGKNGRGGGQRRVWGQESGGTTQLFQKASEGFSTLLVKPNEK